MKTLFYIFIFFNCAILFAQDVHWSQFYDNPLFISPSNTGNHDGEHRIITSYKDQWRSVTKAFQTFSLSYDKKLKNEDLRLGAVFLSDQVGDGKFKTMELLLSSSYFIPLNQKKTHNFLTGIQLGWNHRSFDFNQFYFDEQYNGVTYDPSIQNTEDLAQDKKNNFTLSAGVKYQAVLKNKSLFEFSYSTFNLNQANNSFYQSKVKRDLRHTLFVQYFWNYDKKFKILPSIIFQKQGEFNEFLFGSNFQTHFIKKRSTQVVHFGVFMRLKDAFIVKTGLQYNSWYLGLSYDVNISSLQTASNKRGGFEINLRYILYKLRTENKIYQQCPDFL
ncbi:MAG: PorP/SprF family type IX secretion system membrane protein [Flavobacteriia bacterium]|nr:PorP/SprF family type IX secretion system membrane protein [Flavobacteriia bacterium]